MIKSIYPTMPRPDDDERPIESRKEALQQLESTISERGAFQYKFRTYNLFYFLKTFCCCLIKKESLWYKRNLFKYESYEKQVEMLNEEIDILKHLSNQRVSAFIAKLILRKHQRALIYSFLPYTMDNMCKEDEALTKNAAAVNATTDYQDNELG